MERDAVLAGHVRGDVVWTACAETFSLASVVPLSLPPLPVCFSNSFRPFEAFEVSFKLACFLAFGSDAVDFFYAPGRRGLT